jgi:endonuclease/exonuclease/phosphatase family metal-dependent hydrolase
VIKIVKPADLTGSSVRLVTNYVHSLLFLAPVSIHAAACQFLYFYFKKTKLMKTKFRWLLLLLLPLDLLIVFVVVISLSDYTPKPMEEIDINAKQGMMAVVPDTFSLITWNIGYGGLGREMDFFYDGGQQVRATKSQTSDWFGQISQWLKEREQTEFLLLQEVDFKARRSYRMPQHSLLSEVLAKHHHVQAVNYDVLFVPVPLRAPMGYVKAGMMTFSLQQPGASSRHAYPSIAGWPDRLFLLDRCFIETRYNLPNGKELVVLNTHNSAFVKDQQLMMEELKVIKDKMESEVLAGNAVVAGGDWNMNPPGFVPAGSYSGHRFVSLPVSIPDDFFGHNWQFAYDPSAPSNRHLDQPYAKGLTGSTTIDFFIVSDMLEVLETTVNDIGFQSSDHNPVTVRLRLKHP